MGGDLRPVVHHMGDCPLSINLIASVGKSGQLGAKGHIPWVNIADMEFFKRSTMGGVCIFGQRTLNLLPPLPGRVLHPYAARHATPQDTLLYVNSKYPDWTVWICGGAKTYRAFAPYIDGLTLISYIDYDGPADVYFPFDAFGLTGGNNETV